MLADVMDISKLKVPELRAELSKRGLNTFGTRQVLLDRLSEVLGTQLNTVTSETPNGDNAEPASQADEPPKDFSADASRSPVENGDQSDPKSSSDVEGKRKRSTSRSPKRERSTERDSKRERSTERDSKRSPRRRSRSPQSKQSVSEEPADWENSSEVFLDTYNSDLSLIIEPDGYTAKPRTNGGFSSMWAGVRANHGVIGGKSFYEVKCLKHLSVVNRDSLAGGATHVVRIGWSTEEAGFTLGEEPNSFGYGGTAKKSCDNKFTDYGCKFGEGDIVGAYLEWLDSEAVMRFCVNGVDQGECFRVQKSSLGENIALFPHIYVKNVEFTVNFGQNNQAAWFPPCIPDDDPLTWQMVNNIDPSFKVHGRKPPASKSECEVIMMVGLPGSGKSYYAEQLCKANPEKQYNVLGTNLILDKMKVLHLSRQRNYHGRWNVLIQEATDCLNALFAIASKRRRNYILDQTNVYPSAQRRKMRPFEGFKRKAVVIVPTDEEFRRRIAQREKEEGKEVPETAVLEMKANFGIPKAISDDPDSVFDEVLFTELEAGPAMDLVRTYNEEGQASRPPPEKRQRWSNSRDRNDSRSRSDRGGDFGRGRRDDFRRSPNRRDDRGRRDYRGGYNASRDRSRDRYDRGRDQDAYSRSPNDRFRGSEGRFPGPRGGFRGMGPRGGFGAPFGGPPYGAPGGMPPMRRGGRGGGQMPDAMGRGYGFEGAPPEARGPRGRGGSEVSSFRPGDMDTPYAVDSMYGSAPPGRYDGMPDSSGAPQGGYRGGFGTAPARGAFGGAPDRGFGRMGVRGGRGSGAPSDRSVGPPDRGGRGASYGPGKRAGGSYSEQDAPGGYPMASGRSQQFNNYPPSGPSDTFNSSGVGYPGNVDQSNRKRSAPSSFTTQPPKPSGGFSGTYQRNDYNQSSYSAEPYTNPPNPYPPASYTNQEAYGSSAGAARGARTTRGSGAMQTGQSGYPTGDGSADMQSSESGSLYASGTAAMYGDSRAAAQPPRQSRFDSKPTAPTQSYSNYTQSGYQDAYGGTAGAYGGDTAAPQSNAPRPGRSRFDAAPVSSASQPNQPTQAAQQTQQMGQQPQTYGYGYPAQGSKSVPSATSQTASQQSYNYNYGYPAGYGAFSYGAQSNQPTATNRPATTSGTAISSAPSLYASAISDKTQMNVTQAPATTASVNPTASTAAASYASYYGYGAASMPPTTQPPPAQYGSWPQTGATANMTASAAAYASYYPGYSAYTGYAAPAAPTAMPTTQASATTTQQQQQQQQAMQAQAYYGYRS